MEDALSVAVVDVEVALVDELLDAVDEASAPLALDVWALADAAPRSTIAMKARVRIIEDRAFLIPALGNLWRVSPNS